jgi:hypothetical protein
VIRLSCLQAYSPEGGFGSEDGVRANLEKLQRYWDDAEGAEKTLRTWRIVNLLAATLLGYGARHDGKYVLVKMASEKWGKILRERSVLEKTVWDWDKVAKDVEALKAGKFKTPYVPDGPWASRLRVNLKGRVKTANKKEAAGTGGMKHRPELARFLELLNG